MLLRQVGDVAHGADGVGGIDETLADDGRIARIGAGRLHGQGHVDGVVGDARTARVEKFHAHGQRGDQRGKRGDGYGRDVAQALQRRYGWQAGE